MFFRQIVDPKLAQYAYLIGCQRTGEAILIDPERDIDRYLALAAQEDLKIVAVADTHIHADYLSGLREFAELGVKVYASAEGGEEWQYEWLKGSSYNFQFLKDGDTFKIGNIEFEAVYSPGHTPEHLSYLVTDRGGGADEPMGIVSGDFVFVGDVGRPDLLESAAGMAGMMIPSAKTLYKSIERFLELPDYLRLWPGHGAGSACGKSLGAVPESTVGYEKRFNASINMAQRSENDFVEYILDGQPEPPTYFARMKRDNRQGPRVLGELPTPIQLNAEALNALAGRKDIAVVDTRLDRSAFMAAHVAGSLYAPLDKSFNTIVGSYVDDETPVYLIIEEGDVEEAVRDLVRIGIDDIKGFSTLDTLSVLERSGSLVSIDEVTFAAVLDSQDDDGVTTVDVRRLAEYESIHVPGAVNVAHTRLSARLNEIPGGQKLLVHCRSGARAAAAAAYLAREGHDVAYVNDNFDNWTLAQSKTVEGVA
ncbi:MAG: MBL fold metallo-hydrolase [Bacteroidetes bacterium]|nr:MAG: MBL fold metallo-hydrolase [Bacteroidota bacterium]